MREEEDEFKKRGVRIAVVTFEQDFFARQYVAETGLAWQLLIDGERGLYRSYGMLEASFWDVWGIKSWQAYAGALAKGQLPKPAHDDIYQRGGDVLIDPRGIVRLHHVGSGPADRPEVAVLLRKIGV